MPKKPILAGNKIFEKLKESLSAVLPILLIVLLLSMTVVPLPTSILLCFLFGTVLLIVGMMFFTLGAEMSMTPIGEKVGIQMTRTRKLPLILLLSFLLGAIITMAEPDLQVLAGQVPSIPDLALILTVAAGVGLFLMLAILRIFFRVELCHLLILFYGVVFILSYFVPDNFLAVAFDAGGVTTGPMTVPFIMALGVGVSAVRSDRHASEDSFGLVALCSVGPILAVMTLGMIYHPTDSLYTVAPVPDVPDSVTLGRLFGEALPGYLQEIALSLLPIVVFFAVFQLVTLRLNRTSLARILVGIAYTYIGLVLFLTGANVGFMPAGNMLGRLLAGTDAPWVVVPVAMVMGYFVVKAEPAVYVLNHQVEDVTDGAISAKTMGTALSVGVAISLGLSLVRVLTRISILWLIVPGYVLAIGISFFVPKIYTAIAFDSGGVASGPMTAAFLLPFAQGACLAVGGDVVTDAFGVVAMVALTPLITIQVLGLTARIREAVGKKAPVPEDVYGLLPDDAIIEL